MNRNPRLVTAPRTIIGYHGCSRPIAETILTEGRFLASTNAYDWLGAGIYFWEYAPYRALDWAIAKCARTGEEPAVIRATIRLGRCLNLLDTGNAMGPARAYNQLARDLGMRALPRNTSTGAHFLDREVIDAYCLEIEEQTKRAYQTVRGCYPEGEPIYAGSKILTLAHVQISVRDPACIMQVHLVQFP